MWDNGEVLLSQLRSCGFDPYIDRTVSQLRSYEFDPYIDRAIHQLRVYSLEKSSVLIADNIV